MAARVCAWRARSDLQPPLTLPLFSVSQSTVAGSMPSKYGKQYAVPKEFPSVLKSFTREVLRAQPSAAAVVCTQHWPGSAWYPELQAMASAMATLPAGGHDAHSATALAERHWSAAPEAGHWAPECQPAGWHRPAPGTPVKLITRH